MAKKIEGGKKFPKKPSKSMASKTWNHTKECKTSVKR